MPLGFSLACCLRGRPQFPNDSRVLLGELHGQIARKPAGAVRIVGRHQRGSGYEDFVSAAGGASNRGSFVDAQIAPLVFSDFDEDAIAFDTEGLVKA